MTAPTVIAFEGPSGAGKSTLVRNVAAAHSMAEIVVLPDYTVIAGGPEQLPPAPAKTVEEELAALQFLLNLDRVRWLRGINEHPSVKLVLMDRSVHTFLAHRLAVEQLTGLPVFERCCEMVSTNADIVWPELILYVDTPQELLSTRYRGDEPEYARIFCEPAYNRAFRSYFVPRVLYGETAVSILDGNSATTELTTRALPHISTVFPSLRFP